MFPISLRFMKLNNAQKAAIRILRRAVVRRMRQLRLLQKYVADEQLKIQEVHERLALFKKIAQSLHGVAVESNRNVKYSAKGRGNRKYLEPSIRSCLPIRAAFQ